MVKSVGLQADTYKRLKKLKRPGQSFDGIVQELMDGTREKPALEVDA